MRSMHGGQHAVPQLSFLTILTNGAKIHIPMDKLLRIRSRSTSYSETPSLKESLLNLIVCPACHHNLDLTIKKRMDREIEHGSLKCKQCSAAYPIVRGIPRFVTSDHYTRSFSAEWNLFSTTQLDRGTTTGTRETFAEKTGLSPDKVTGKVLEAGCGMGRFLEVLSHSQGVTVVGFDLSLAVEAAYKNVGSRDNVHILQADVMKPPFNEQSFDLVYSLGVIHHTSNPKEAFMKLVSLVRRGGQIAIWVYQKYRRPPLSDFYRIFTSRMPWSTVLALSILLSHLYWLQKHWSYFLVLFPMSTLADPERRVLDTLDWYSPKYQFKFTRGDIVDWFLEAGLQEIEVLSNPISVKGRVT